MAMVLVYTSLSESLRIKTIYTSVVKFWQLNLSTHFSLFYFRSESDKLFGKYYCN